jgi:hypothetical protein
LREKPEISARSLGEYYSGAPMRVLEKGKTWSRVRVGGREGYMPNQSLAFGKELRALDPILERKAAVRRVTPCFCSSPLGIFVHLQQVGFQKLCIYTNRIKHP